jgi:quercetin dioxygenase-like cupin family protein
MKIIKFIEKFDLGGEIDSEKAIEAKQIYTGSRRQIIEIKLSSNAVLSKHKAAEPITILCLSGSGKFLAGADLQEEMALEPGTFLTLEAEVLHEVIATSALHILLTKFKQG